MSIDAVTGRSGGPSAAMQAQLQQMRENFKQLGNSLGSGNLADAQKAYAALQDGTPTPPGGKDDGKNPFKADMDAIGQALQSGNLEDARKAFAKIQQEMQSRKAGHRHGGRHGHGEQAPPPADAATNPSTAANGVDITV